MKLFITIAIALCLTAPLLAAKNTCVSPCVTCEKDGEDHKCTQCFQKKITTGSASGDIQGCDATQKIDNCELSDATKCYLCKGLFAPTFTTQLACVAVTEVTDCIQYEHTAADANTCLVCNGAKYPKTPDAGGAKTCVAIAAAAVTGCAGYKGDGVCGACNSEFVYDTTAAANADACVAYGDNNKGCGWTAGAKCSKCNAMDSYFATGYDATNGVKCSKNSTIMMIKIAFALVIASLF